MQDNREEFKKTWNPRFTLRSHFDAIRALTFHPNQAVLLTASEDGTLKLWNLNKAMHSKKWAPQEQCICSKSICAATQAWNWSLSQVEKIKSSLHRNAALDVEPIYTFRAHRWVLSKVIFFHCLKHQENKILFFSPSGAVLSLTMGEEGESCYSGGLDGSVRCWKMPDLNVDPYDNYGQWFLPQNLSPNKISSQFKKTKKTIVFSMLISVARSWNWEQHTSRTRGQRLGSHLLCSSPSSCFMFSRRHHSYLGPSELSSLPVSL